MGETISNEEYQQYVQAFVGVIKDSAHEIGINTTKLGYSFLSNETKKRFKTAYEDMLKIDTAKTVLDSALSFAKAFIDGGQVVVGGNRYDNAQAQLSCLKNCLEGVGNAISIIPGRAGIGVEITIVVATEIIDVTSQLVDKIRDHNNNIEITGYLCDDDPFYSNLYDIMVDEEGNIDKDAYLEACKKHEKNHGGGLGSDMDDARNSSDPVRSDPIILDLDNDGVYSKSIEDGIHFDFEGDGFKEKTAWVDNGDGLLVRDIDGNGNIDSAKELFSDETIMKDGSIASSGFAALADIDDNKDGLINKSDASFADLKIWKDLNNDGISQAEELFSLEDLDIIELVTSNQVLNKLDTNNNLVMRQGTYKTADNVVHKLAELDFTANTMDTIYIGDETTDISGIKDLPELYTTGEVLTLRQAMVLNSNLKNMVDEFAKNYQMGDCKSIIEKIVFEWTNTKDVVDGSRGSNVSAKHLAVLEKFYGTEFVGVNGSNPNMTAGAILENMYNTLISQYKNEMLSQTHLKGLLCLTSLVDNADGTKTFSYDDVSNYIKIIGKDSMEKSIDLFQKYTEFIKADKIYSAFYDDKTYANSFAKTSVYYELLTNIKSNRKIHGDELNNTLNGSSEADLIFGGVGNDQLEGGRGNDLLVGGTGNDTLNGGDGTDIYQFNLGDGADTINNYDSTTTRTDKIVFGEGILAEDIVLTRDADNMYLTNTKSGDKITVQRAFNTYYGIGSIAFQDGTVWDATYITNKLRTSVGTSGDDRLTGWNGTYSTDINESFYAGAGNDKVYGNSGNDQLYGEDGNDILDGGDGVDSLYGGNGSDQLEGGNGNDLLIGGTGNDTLYGGDGTDIYQFNLGDGVDTINNYDSTTTRTDKIVFGEGILAEDIVLTRDADNMYLTNTKSGDKITVQRAFNTYYGIGSIAFQDGTVWDATYITNKLRTSVGTSGDDRLTGWNGTYSTDINESFYAGAGNDKVYGNSGNDQLYGEDGNDILDGGDGVDSLYGGNGSDQLEGGNGNDLLIGGTGNDTLYGGDGTDIYQFNLGDGVDTINNYDSTTTRTDKIVFGEGILAEDLDFMKIGSDLIIKNLDSEDSVIVKNHFSTYYSIGGISLSDGSSLSMTNIEKLIQDMAAFETSTGMLWEDAIEKSDTGARSVLDELWVKAI